MKNDLLNTGVLSGVMVLSLIGCDKLFGPQTSYCEALCDWAVECAGDESALSVDEMMSRCAEATNDSDSVCKEAENGDLNPDDSLANGECVDDVATMGCGGLTGSETDVLAGRPPEVTCIGAYGALSSGDPEGVYNTYNAARNAVLLTGGELCDDVTVGLCENLIGCVPDLGDDDDARDLAMDSCMDSMSSFTSSCKSDGLYDQDLPIDYNIPRGFAQSCVEALAASDSLCSPSSWIDIADCAGAFVDPLSGTSLIDSVMSGASGFLD
jgi:hypothetical protein